MRFTVSKSSPIVAMGFERPTLKEALELAASMIDEKDAWDQVRIFDSETNRSYDENEILTLLRKGP